MHSIKPVGRAAASRKYDLLTALGAWALARGKTDQRMALRLMTLVTARYNWSREELAVGQREIARMWACDERTVKREMARLRALGWLVVKRQGARGRVAEYRLDIDAVLDATRPQWEAVGPDYELRMSGHAEPAGAEIVPLPVRGEVAAPDLSAGTEWALALGLLHQEDVGVYATWLKPLQRAERSGGRLTLRAPSRFHASYVNTHYLPRILRACQVMDEAVTEVVLVV
jgi:hypothetical protein